MKGMMQARERFIERRKSQRIAVTGGHASFLPLTEGAASSEGEALLLNLSLHGCQLESEQILPHNQPYQLILHVPSHLRPFRIEKAITRWIDGHLHGLQFLDLDSECEVELRSAIRDLSPAT